MFLQTALFDSFLWLSSIPLCVYVCVYMYVYIPIYTHMCIYTHMIYTHTYLYISTYLYHFICQWTFGFFPGLQFSSVSQSCLTLWDPMDCSNARPPSPSPTPKVYSNSCPSSQWCHPTISSSVVPFSSCLQSFPASWHFPMSQFFTSGGQNIGVSASASVLPMNTQDWFLLGWTGWVSLQSKGLSRVLQSTVQKHQFFGAQLSLQSNSHIHTWPLEKP